MSRATRRPAKPAPEPVAPEPVKTKQELLDDLIRRMEMWLASDTMTLKDRLNLIRDRIAAATDGVDGGSLEATGLMAVNVEDAWGHGESAERHAGRLPVLIRAVRDLHNNRHMPPDQLMRILIESNRDGAMNDLTYLSASSNPFTRASFQCRYLGRADARRDVDQVLVDARRRIDEAPESREED